MADKVGCGSCKWAKFQMTAHNPPRVKQNAFGECSWPKPYFKIADSWQAVYHKTVIWPHNGATCPVWESK